MKSQEISYRVLPLALVAWRTLVYLPKQALLAIRNIGVLVVLIVFALIGRFKEKNKIGVGPEPLINNVYHVKALRKAGFEAESFVTHLYFITDDFDVRFDRVNRFIRPLAAYCHVVLNYACIYLYFNGGPLWDTRFRKMEPLLLKLALVRTVVMPYGGDVCDLSRTQNLVYRNATSKDYPTFQKLTRKRTIEQIDRWTKYADHIISGCDWVEYLYHWDTLMLGHFSIDLEAIKPSGTKTYPAHFSLDRPLRLLHAPNHKNIKGTKHFENAIERLKGEGCAIDLKIIQKVPNDIVRASIEEADVVLDQLVIGWYAMFAIEAMALERPVVCYLDDRFRRLYEAEGLVAHDEIPIINADIDSIYEVVKGIYFGTIDLTAVAAKERSYLARHHSLEYVGSAFKRINEELGIFPARY